MYIKDATLVYQNNGVQKTIAKISSSDIEIFDKYLFKNMKTLGIRIPDILRSEFNGRNIVYLEKENNALFIKAFKEIYCPSSMPANLYHWQ